MREAIDAASVSTLSPPSARSAPGPAATARAAIPDTRFLDGLRALAAFYVLVHHALWLARSTPATGTWAKVLAVLSLAFKHGHAAVIFFFVLSGFVIHLRYAKHLEADPLGARFNWLDFVY